jgi:hypothetical protein
MPAPSYEEIHKSIERRYSRRFRLFSHVIMAGMTLGALWALGSVSARSLTLVSILWSGLLICHALKVFMDELKDRAVRQALHLYKQDADFYTAEDKPKRTMRLMDNSEVEIIEEEPLYESNGKGHRTVNRSSGQ